jgi:hypothetical protein
MSQRFQILSLDGGGIKGLFSAALLAYIEEDLQTEITKHFDLIVGTSTGGIIALGLGLGIKPAKILDFYVQKGRYIFPPSGIFNRRSARHWVRHKYNNAPLERALRSCFGDSRLGESKKRLVIPSFNLADNDVKLFKTAHHKRFRRDYKLEAWKIAMATSAAPTYFPGFNDIDHQRKIRLEEISILSLGTLEDVPKRPKRLQKGGKLQWTRQVIEVLFAGQSIGAVKQVTLVLGKDKVFRINPTVPEGLFSMDCYSPEELIAKAAHHSQHAIPRIHEQFFCQEALEFTPFHYL